jgi:nucleoside-diphosphate-sugar epimerase
MTIILTGGLGHIGSRLLKNQIFQHFIVVDNLSTQRFSSLFNLPRNSVTFIEKDVRDLSTKDLSNFGEIEGLIHLAAITDASGTAHRGSEVIDHNSTATKVIIEICQEMHIPMIFPSSTSVYGSQTELVDEECRDLFPQSPYAESKLREEEMIWKAKEEGLKAVILRLGTISGVSQGMRFHTAVNRFCWLAANDKKMQVWRTAIDQKRPYLSLSDFEKAISHIFSKVELDSTVYNLVSANYTVREILKMISKALGEEVETEFVDDIIMNQLSYEVSNNRFKNTGFQFEGDVYRDIYETLQTLIGIRKDRTRHVQN